MLREPERMLEALRHIHERIRDRVVQACEQQSTGQLAAVAGHEGGDVVYAIDRVSERALREHFAPFAEEWPCVLVAEGLGSSGTVTLPSGAHARNAEVRALVDPIDGTRGLMYQKRSAWILTGIAPNRGDQNTLADIELALQTEIPLLKQHLADTVWTIRGQGARGERYNRLTGGRSRLRLRPSTATTITHGFGAVARFFPGSRARLAAVDDDLVERLLGPLTTGTPLVFEDQYISTGGQLYELMSGHDRWVVDLRPLVHTGTPNISLCAHPYDLASELVARESGVVVTDLAGRLLAAPFDVQSNVAWMGFANQSLAGQVGPAIRATLKEHGLL